MLCFMSGAAVQHGQRRDLFGVGGAELAGQRAPYPCLLYTSLISFLTDGKKECRAWTIRRGTKAPQAAGKIHSDFERGFIRASVVKYDDLAACGYSMANVKAKGCLLYTSSSTYVLGTGLMTVIYSLRAAEPRAALKRLADGAENTRAYSDTSTGAPYFSA